MDDSMISIIIPHFARPALLAEAVASVRLCAFIPRDYEILIVDDGSNEQDWLVVQSMAGENVRVFRRSDGQKGPSRCRNIGLLEARGKYVIFLDSDDLMAPWCIEDRMNQVVLNPGADLWVFPVMLFKKVPGDIDLLWNAMTGDYDPAERFARSDPPWHTSSPLWKRESLLRLGGFNEEVFYGDDSDLHLRALVDGLIVSLYPEALPDAFVRRSDEPRITNDLSAMLIESRRIRLREGTRFLKSRSGTSRLLDWWEGQYFVAAEFLLFNQHRSSDALRAVLNDLEQAFPRPLLLRFMVQAYFSVALACRRHAYLVLRVARRVAMKVLPAEYFPTGGQYHSATISATAMAAVLERLAQGNSPRESP
jgi:glycosyltransferase involved in cell wall biosynthesis